MIKIEHSVTINRPLQEVYEFVVDIDNAPQWRSGVLEVHKNSPEIEVGAIATEVLQFMGRRLETTYEITEYVPNRVFAFKTISGPIPMEGTSTFEEVGGATKISFVIQGEPSGVLKLAEAMVAQTARRQIKTDYANLKALLESRG